MITTGKGDQTKQWTGFEHGMGIGGWLTNYKRVNCLPPDRRLVLTVGDMEHFLFSVAGRSEIWYATNGEIADYLHAQQLLKVSVDERIFYNPSGMDVWVEKDKKDILRIPARERIRI